MAAILVVRCYEISNLYRGPSINDSYQFSVRLAKRFQRRVLEINQLVTRIAHAWRSCVFVNGSGRNERWLQRTSFHRCFLPSVGSFGPAVSKEKIQMRKVIIRRIPSNGKSSHSLWPGELKHKLSRGLSIEHSYPGFFQLAHWFQRRRLKTDNTFFDTFWPFVNLVSTRTKKGKTNF